MEKVMNKKLKLVTLLTAALMAGCATSPTTNPNVNVEVLWGDLDSFTDIDAGTSGKQNFRNTMIREFEKHITTLAAKLPDGYQLYMVIEDVDLAGSVNSHYWVGKEPLRVHDAMYAPEITFTYRLKNAAGEFIAAQDKFTLKNNRNMGYLSRHFSNKPFAYEKRLLKSWFNAILIPYVKTAPSS
jgi:hypothetical protein